MPDIMAKLNNLYPDVWCFWTGNFQYQSCFFEALILNIINSFLGILLFAGKDASQIKTMRDYELVNIAY